MKVVGIAVVRTGSDLEDPIPLTVASDLSSFGFFQRQVSDKLGVFRSCTLVNDVRRELAMRHVLQSDRPLTEVAALLGFSAPSAFSRWYGAQFGRSASRSRAERAGVV